MKAAAEKWQVSFPLTFHWPEQVVESHSAAQLSQGAAAGSTAGCLSLVLCGPIVGVKGLD